MLIDCHECQAKISDQAESCPRCGAPTAYLLRDVVVSPTGVQKSRGLAALQALLLGGIGAHKFYLERPGQGVLYFLLCWTFVPAIIAFVEGINYALMSEAEFQQRYGADQRSGGVLFRAGA